MQISTRTEDFIIDTLELRSDMSILNETFTDPAIVKVSCHIHQNSLVVFVWLLDFGGSCSVCFILLLLLLYFCLLIFLVVLHLMVKVRAKKKSDPRHMSMKPHSADSL